MARPPIGIRASKEGEEVHYRVFNEKIDSIGIACDVWKNTMAANSGSAAKTLGEAT